MSLFGKKKKQKDAGTDPLGYYGQLVYQPVNYGLTFNSGNTTDAKALPKPPLPVRRSTQPIRAWRQWYLVQRDGDVIMRSLVREDVWEGPILRANEKPGDWTPVGDSSHTAHGIYAYPVTQRISVPAELHRTDYSLSYMMAMLNASSSRLGVKRIADGTIEGEVELLGRVVRHTNGYRAEAARVVRLWITQLESYLDRDRVIASLSERYQCDVAFMPGFKLPEPEAAPDRKTFRKRMKKAGLITPTKDDYLKILGANNGTR